MKSPELKSMRLEQLLELYQRSNTEAFEEFFHRTSHVIFRFLCVKIGNMTEAEDVMQETYFRIHRFVTSYDPDRNAVTWVMSIARNAMFDHLRTKKERGAMLSYQGLDTQSHELGADDQLELRQLIEQVASGLSSDDCQLLIDRLFYGATHEEIAREREISPENARQKISRLLRRLRSGFSAP